MSEVEVIETSSGPAKIQRTGRRTLAIHVLPDGSLELTAPVDSKVETILAKIEKRSRWIAIQRRNFSEMNVRPVAPRYVTGATHRYLGRQYRLRINRGEPASVRLKGAFFEIVAPTNETEIVKKLLTQWFRARSKEQFAKRLEYWRPWCAKHRLPEPLLKIRLMSKRWGSAGNDGKIVLNPELIHTPSRCIDYVIVHEVCHLRYPNHDGSFYRQLSALIPDWKNIKKRLEEAALD